MLQKTKMTPHTDACVRQDFIHLEAQRVAIHSSCTDMRQICIKFLSNSEASVVLDCVLEYKLLIFCERLVSLEADLHL